MNFHEFFQGVIKGMEPMITAGVILLLAWAIGGVCRELLGTPEYVSNLFQTLGVPGAILPMMVFVFAAFLSFSTGTSWGTFGILLPIVAPVAQAIAPNLIVASLAATLAGSIFGDHCSPISDTTILSSTGASCKHLDHVGSQMPYALTVAACSLVGYILIGITGSGILGLVVSAVLLVAAMFVLHRAAVKKYGTGDEAEAAA
jgi:Na+/H+ antiporter NhaC